MAGEPRKHHYVPQFYLAGFTDNDSKDGQLFVLDKAQRKTWTSTPKGTAHKRDFHRISAGPEGDDMAVEKSLGQVEGRWSNVLLTVIENTRLPEDEPFGDLMMFVAFMAVRVRRIRNVLSDFIGGLMKTQIQLMLSKEDGRKQFRRELAELGHEMTDEEFDRLIEFGQGGEYTANYEQTWYVQQMVQMAATLAPLLSLRKWCLWIAEDDAPDLICSDNPVAPTWAVPAPGPMSPAFGTPNTIVSVPLNRRMAMVSMIEEELPGTRLDRKGVAAVNSMTAKYANQVYSPTPDFVWVMKDGGVGNTSNLLDALGGD
jgi:hypothetical protein